MVVFYDGTELEHKMIIGWYSMVVFNGRTYILIHSSLKLIYNLGRRDRKGEQYY